MSGGDPSEVTHVVARNISALVEVQRALDRQRPLAVRLADAVTGFTGSMAFVALHALLFGGWILLNSRVLPVRPWDPFPFVMLAMAASVEAIFLSTFVLISQNRQAQLAQRRADLDLQINLLAEHEITRLIQLVDALCRKQGIEVEDRPHLQELERDVRPEQVLQDLEREEHDAAPNPEHPPPSGN